MRYFQPMETTTIQFTNIVTPSKKERKEGRQEIAFLRAPDEESARLASIVIYRIENPKARKDTAPAKVGKVTRAQRRAAWNARPARRLSLQDKQDAAQEVFALIAAGIHLKEDGIAEIFRSVRDLLRMNGGNHDKGREDELEEIHFARSLTPRASYRGAPERLKLASLARDLRARAFRAFSADKSRKRRASLRYHLQTIRRMICARDPLAVDCPVLDVATSGDNRRSAWQDRAASLRRYAFDFNSLDAAMLAADMSSL
jgi:hypothetical protein